MISFPKDVCDFMREWGSYQLLHSTKKKVLVDGYFGQVNSVRDDSCFEHRLETVSDVTDMLVADFEERAKIVEATGSWLPMEWFWDFMPRQSKAEIKGDKILKMSSLLRPIRGCYSWSFTVHDPKRRESLGDRDNTGIITGVHLRAHVLTGIITLLVKSKKCF